jgi:putative nucleotidyltransferase with HDIG domain
MRERLLELIPEFNMIQDADLREKALQTYGLALQEGGWTPDDLTRIPFTLLLNPCPASYVEHVRAVTLCAVEAAKVFAQVYGDRLPVHMDLLVTGALLHDVGKLVEYEGRSDGMTVTTSGGRLLRHPLSGMEIAARTGLPVQVLHIIAAHADEGDKVNRTTEATLVNHADFMNFHSFQRAAKAAGAPAQSRM